MQLDTVYQKTELGQAEIQNRQLGLSQRERNLLILVDGQRPVSAILTAASDLVVALAQFENLINLNLIKAVSATDAKPTPPALSPAQQAEIFQKKKLKASKALQNILGPEADRLCLLLEACKTDEEFDSRFEKTVQVVRQLRTPAMAAAFKEVALGF
jgi:hypothetical protein